MRTFHEIKTCLKQLDEILLLELLNVTSEDLVERFADVIEENHDRFEHELAGLFDDENTETESD